MYKKTILPDGECALVSKNNREDIELIRPTGVTENKVEMTTAVYYLLVCYYRFLQDREFVQVQMDWLTANAKDGLDFGEFTATPAVSTH